MTQISFGTMIDARVSGQRLNATELDRLVVRRINLVAMVRHCAQHCDEFGTELYTANLIMVVLSNHKL